MMKLHGIRRTSFWKSVPRPLPTPTTRNASTQSVDVAIVGGGVVGCATAQALTKRGASVILLEQNQLSSGTTWRAAGLLGSLKCNAFLQQLAAYGTKVYSDMNDEVTGKSLVGFAKTGSLRIARCGDSMEQLVRMMQIANGVGFSQHSLVTPAEIKEIHPFLNVDGIAGGVFSHEDAICNSSDVALMMAQQARQGGAIVMERTECTGIKLDDTGRRILELHTDSGDAIVAGSVVFCGGAWTKNLSMLAFGRKLPVATVPHQYIIFDKCDGVGNHLPVVRDTNCYLKPEGGGFMVGMFGADPAENFSDVVKAGNANAKSIDKAGPWLDLIMEDVPTLRDSGVKQWLHGADTHSADHLPLIGLVPGADNCYVATGFNAQGIECGPGAGVAIAESIMDGSPHSISADFAAADPSRFFPGLCEDTDSVEQRAAEGSGKSISLHPPHESFPTSRGRRKSALHTHFAKQRAVFGEVYGLERPLYVPTQDERASPVTDDLETSTQEHLSFRHACTERFTAERRECIAARTSTALFDLSAFGKLKVSGPNSLDTLQMCFTAEMDKPVGTVTYSLYCDSRGRILGDVTVARLGPDEFYVVTLAVQPKKVMERLFRIGLNLGFRGQQLVVEDVSDANAVLAVNGPRARDILSSLTSTPLSNLEFPCGTAQHLTVAGTEVLALRVSFAGELGWELHCPSFAAGEVFEAVSGAGEKHGAVPAGFNCLMNSLRVEKAFMHYGSDISSLETPLEAGLGFACKLKPDQADFEGKASIVAQKQEGIRKRLVSVRAAASHKMSLFGHKEELLYRDGELVGSLTSGGFSFTLNCHIGLGYVRGPAKVPLDWLKAGSYEVEVPVRGDADNVNLHRFPVDISLNCLVDPKRERVLGL